MDRNIFDNGMVSKPSRFCLQTIVKFTFQKGGTEGAKKFVRVLSSFDRLILPRTTAIPSSKLLSCHYRHYIGDD